MATSCRCFVCLKSTLQRCTECKSVYYCTIQCQQSDSERHQKDCAKLKQKFDRQRLQTEKKDELIKMQREIKKMSVYELQKKLEKLGLSSKGRLSTLQKRYYSVFKVENNNDIDIKQDIDSLILYGYIRIYIVCILNIKITKIPTEIIKLCLLFYKQCDEFDKDATDRKLKVFYINNNINMNERNNCIERTGEYNTMYSIGFGTLNIENGQKKIWKFRINKNDNLNKKIYCKIGIYHKYTDEYELNLSDSKIYHNHKCMMQTLMLSPNQSNHVIFMSLDMVHATLTYVVNKQIFCIENINTNHPYKMMVSMMNPKEQIQLLQ